MTEQQLVEIEERASMATAGPWKVLRRGTIVGHKDTEAVQPGWAFLDWICSMQVSNCPNFRNDSEFIAHAREDVTALCAALRETREQVAALEAVQSGKLGGDLAAQAQAWQEVHSLCQELGMNYEGPPAEVAKWTGKARVLAFIRKHIHVP